MAAAGMPRQALPGQHQRTALGNFGGAGSISAAPSADIEIVEGDFDAFEKLLVEIQTGYGAEDLSALRARVTPEMLSYFSEDLAANASRGVVNQISDVKLLQGDLAEAWREGDREYATVAMRFGLDDRTIKRATGQVVETGPSEATELWTFMRIRGGAWLLSAIQQT
jgi:predicted lipid-binding transport protein (Tim44 family)